MGVNQIPDRGCQRQSGQFHCPVPQEPFLFYGTIRDNVAFAKPNATDDEIHEAIAHVGLSETVSQLADGVDTLVHERGVSLSAGERQLIALARAFMASPKSSRIRRGDLKS